MRARSIATDGANNRLRFLALTNGGPIWDAVQMVPPLRQWLNAALIDHAVREMPARPEPLSTLAPYTSWHSLTDRSYNGRHLPPSRIDPDRLPAAEEAAELFRRGPDMIPCRRSTVLFAYFAQWFTDGFLQSIGVVGIGCAVVAALLVLSNLLGRTSRQLSVGASS